MSMCTREDVREIIHTEMDVRLADFIRKSWYLIIAVSLATASAWFSLYFQVQAQDVQMENTKKNNTQLLELNQREIDNLREDYKSDIKDIKEDLKFIREKI